MAGVEQGEEVEEEEEEEDLGWQSGAKAGPPY